jgi:hypothetical protein
VRYIQLVEFDSRHPAQEIRQALDDWLAPCAGSARCRWRSSLRITSARITNGEPAFHNLDVVEHVEG